jgi:O-succinylbenzoate synthase
MAKAALEMSCWALEAEVSGQPLAAVLGGSRREIPVGISLGIQPTPRALVEKALAARAEGYRRVKLKIMPGADLDYVAAVREALPDHALSVDANAAYRPADTAHLARLDRFRLVMIEQPLEPEDLRRHAELQRCPRTPWRWGAPGS